MQTKYLSTILNSGHFIPAQCLGLCVMYSAFKVLRNEILELIKRFLESLFKNLNNVCNGVTLIRNKKKLRQPSRNSVKPTEGGHLGI